MEQLLAGGSGGRSRGGFGSGGNGQFHQLEDGFHAGVARTLTDADDTGVTTRTVLEHRGNLVEQDMDHVVVITPGLAQLSTLLGGSALEVRARLLTQFGGSQTAKMHVVRLRCPDGMTTERDQFLNHGTNGLGLGNRRGDPLMFDDAGSQIREHRIAVVRLAPEFAAAFKVTHMKG